MPKWTNYSSKPSPSDDDELMIFNSVNNYIKNNFLS